MLIINKDTLNRVKQGILSPGSRHESVEDVMEKDYGNCYPDYCQP